MSTGWAELWPRRRQAWVEPAGRAAGAAPATRTDRVELDRLNRATRLYAEILALDPAEASAALEYVNRLRRLGVIAASLPVPVAPMPLPAPRQVAGPEPAPEHGPDPESAAPADVSVRMLGPLDVVVGATPIQTWGGTRVRSVLQYLLLQGRGVHREVLMELFWPGYAYKSARNNLNVCLYALRQALGTEGPRDYIVYRDCCYTLNRSLAWSVDRIRFQQAADRAKRAAADGRIDASITAAWRAVEEYGGPLFDGEPAADWFVAERTALAELYTQTLESLAGLCLDRGDLDATQGALRRLLQQDGSRESAHRLAMVCYAKRNQRDLVARQFHRCVAQLDQELEIAPSPETVRLYRELLEADPPDHAVSRDSVHSGPGSRMATSSDRTIKVTVAR